MNNEQYKNENTSNFSTIKTPQRPSRRRRTDIFPGDKMFPALICFLIIVFLFMNKNTYAYICIAILVVRIVISAIKEQKKLKDNT